MLASLSATLGVALLSGCGCMGVGLSQVTPSAQVLRVGESLTLRYETGGGCRSGDGLTDVDLHVTATVWSTTDTLVVVVDSLTGRVTGRAPGDAWVVAGGSAGSRIHVQ